MPPPLLLHLLPVPLVRAWTCQGVALVQTLIHTVFGKGNGKILQAGLFVAAGNVGNRKRTRAMLVVSIWVPLTTLLHGRRFLGSI